jgi:hypothetical protein
MWVRTEPSPTTMPLEAAELAAPAPHGFIAEGHPLRGIVESPAEADVEDGDFVTERVNEFRWAAFQPA